MRIIIDGQRIPVNARASKDILLTLKSIGENAKIGACSMMLPRKSFISTQKVHHSLFQCPIARQALTQLRALVCWEK